MFVLDGKPAWIKPCGLWTSRDHKKVFVPEFIGNKS